MEITKQQNKTSADKTSIGFDYQYLYFIYRALGLKPGDQIGYEVKDDVHLELNDGVEEFIQLKHSLQEGKDNTVINMTERDSDLWKSLYNWSVSINEREPDKRLDYLQDKKFILVTNKNNNNNNFFIKTKQLQKKEIELNDYKNYISSLEKSVDGESKSSKKLKKYIEYFRNQDDGVLEQFVKKLNVTLAFDDLINKIKDQILSAHIDNRKLDEIFELCIGNLSIWKYEKIKNHGKVMISFEDINKKIKNCFTAGAPLRSGIRTPAGAVAHRHAPGRWNPASVPQTRTPAGRTSMPATGPASAPAATGGQAPSLDFSTSSRRAHSGRLGRRRLV